jgi:hypothetical protein
LFVTLQKTLTLNSLLSFILNCALTTSPFLGRPSSAILSCSVRSSGAFDSASIIRLANSSSSDQGVEQVLKSLTIIMMKRKKKNLLMN